MLGFIWTVHILAYLFAPNLWTYGINPRDLSGLMGILFTPVLHANWSHLAANTPPLVVMVTLLFYGYPKSAKQSLAGIWIISGLLTWFFARDNIHIGFSGVNHGLMFFLFTIGVLRKDHRSIALAMIVFFLYGGMIWSVFPNDPDISFELHFFGSVSGILLAFIYRNKDLKQLQKKYQWEGEDDIDNAKQDNTEFAEGDQDDLIGDAWKLEKDEKHDTHNH